MYFLHVWIVLTQRWQRGNAILVLLLYYEKFATCPARKNSLPWE